MKHTRCACGSLPHGRLANDLKAKTRFFLPGKNSRDVQVVSWSEPPRGSFQRSALSLSLSLVYQILLCRMAAAAERFVVYVSERATIGQSARGTLAMMMADCRPVVCFVHSRRGWPQSASATPNVHRTLSVRSVGGTMAGRERANARGALELSPSPVWPVCIRPRPFEYLLKRLGRVGRVLLAGSNASRQMRKSHRQVRGFVRGSSEMGKSGLCIRGETTF